MMRRLALLLWTLLRCSPVLAAQAPETPTPVRWAQRLDGEVVRFEGNTSVIVLLGTECPIARKAIGTVNRVAEDVVQAGGVGQKLQVFALLSDPTITREQAQAWAKEWGVSVPVLWDASGILATQLGAEVTPQGFVIDSTGAIRYRGRIDDGYVSIGKPRAEVTSHDLRDAAEAVSLGTAPVKASTQAVGCLFEGWKHDKKDAQTLSVTYHRDIAPILAANCVSCHTPGQVAPFSLTRYEDAAKRAQLLAQVTRDRYMPPWKAAPQVHRFADERRLDDREIALFQAWADADAPEGSPADAAPAASRLASAGEPVTEIDGRKWMLGTPDVVLEMTEAFPVPASGRDIYRAFPLRLPAIPEGTYISAVEFQPGAPTVVHHAIFYLDASGTAAKKAAASKDGLPGYMSFGGPGFLPSGGLGGWAPGATPYRLPDGVGRSLREASDVVIQVHYHPDGKAREDRSRIALYFAKAPVKQVVVSVPMMNRQIDIPPGEKNYIREMSLTLPEWLASTDRAGLGGAGAGGAVQVLGVTPHMHLLGTSMTLTATLPDGTQEQLISVPHWDFRWQDQYRYIEPIKLPPGTRLHCVATYDNSSENPANPNTPPQRVRRGEQTTDEMCLMFVSVLVDKDSWMAQGLRLGRLKGKTAEATE